MKALRAFATIAGLVIASAAGATTYTVADSAFQSSITTEDRIVLPDDPDDTDSPEDLNGTDEPTDGSEEETTEAETDQGETWSPDEDEDDNDQGLDPGERVEVADGIVVITTSTNQGIGAGTGMILSDDGLVLTNYHVIADSTTIRVLEPDSDEYYLAEMLGYDPVRDVALIKLEDASGLPVVDIDDSGVSVGDTVFAIGNGNGQHYLTKLTGDVVATDKSIMVQDPSVPSGRTRLDNLIQLEADVVPGYSGGPLVNENRDVVGVTSAASMFGKISGYAIPIDEAMEIVNHILAGEEVGDVRLGRHGAMGVSVSDSADGPTIVDVTPGSPAEQIGIEPGDIIRSVDGTDVTNVVDVTYEVSQYRVGDRIPVTWETPSGSIESGYLTLTDAVQN